MINKIRVRFRVSGFGFRNPKVPGSVSGFGTRNPKPNPEPGFKSYTSNQEDGMINLIVNNATYMVKPRPYRGTSLIKNTHPPRITIGP